MRHIKTQASFQPPVEGCDGEVVNTLATRLRVPGSIPGHNRTLPSRFSIALGWGYEEVHEEWKCATISSCLLYVHCCRPVFTFIIMCVPSRRLRVVSGVC